MTTIHIPNGTIQATSEAIEASQPGDELVLDAGTYVFDTTLHIKNDRCYLIVNQRIEASDSFRGDTLFEIDNNVEFFILHSCSIDIKKDGVSAIGFRGRDFRGLIADNIVTGHKGASGFRAVFNAQTSSYHDSPPTA